MQRIVRYVQRECFGKMMQALSDSSPDALEDVINKLATHTANDKASCRLTFHTLSPTLHTSRQDALD